MGRRKSEKIPPDMVNCAADDDDDDEDILV